MQIPTNVWEADPPVVDSSEALIYHSNIMKVFFLTGKNAIIIAIFDLLQWMGSTVSPYRWIFSCKSERECLCLSRWFFFLGCMDMGRPKDYMYNRLIGPPRATSAQGSLCIKWNTVGGNGQVDLLVYNPWHGFFLLPEHLGGFIERCSWIRSPMEKTWTDNAASLWISLFF